MKPSNCASIKMKWTPRTSTNKQRKVSTLYLAAALLLVSALMTLGSGGSQQLLTPVAAQSAAAAASKSVSPQVTGGGRSSSSSSSSSPSSSSSSSIDDNNNSNKNDDDDHHLALPSTPKAQKRLMPISHTESVYSERTSTRASDLNIGQSNIANAKVQVSSRDMATAAGHHHGKSHHGKYYMYAESPKKGAYKMGFRRGNHKHMIERKESSHKGHVHSYFKWHDKKGKGSHKFEFKHYDKKGKHHY